MVFLAEVRFYLTIVQNVGGGIAISCGERYCRPHGEDEQPPNAASLAAAFAFTSGHAEGPPIVALHRQ
jgi:hypothetical protein